MRSVRRLPLCGFEIVETAIPDCVLVFAASVPAHHTLPSVSLRGMNTRTLTSVMSFSL